MSAIINNPACEHAEVSLRRTMKHNGNRFDYWECNGCGRRFWAEKAEASSSELDLQTAVNVYKHTVKELNAQVAGLRAELEMLRHYSRAAQEIDRLKAIIVASQVQASEYAANLANADEKITELQNFIRSLDPVRRAS